MRIFFVYLCMELKRAMKVLQKTILFTVAGILLILAMLFVINSQFQEKQSLKLVDVAVVIPEEESLVRLGAQFISAIDSAESICHFDYMQEDEALLKLQQNDVQAVVVFPENFYEDVYSGVNTPAVIYFNDIATLNVSLFRELLTDGVSMLQISEAGVYSVLDVSRSDPPSMRRNKIGDFVAQKYIETILSRTRIYEEYVVSPYGTVGFTEYYFSVFVLLIMFIYSLNMGFLYKGRIASVADKMNTYGLGSIKLSVIRILVIASQLWLIALLVYVMACGISEAGGIYFIYFDISTVFGLFLLSLGIAVYVHAVYIWAGNGSQGTTILLAAHIIMILSAGLLIPTTYLPEIVEKITPFIPAANWNEYCQLLLFQQNISESMIQLFVWIAVWSGIGLAGLWKNTRFGFGSC